MRYSREHKQETHARIVRKASVRLREKGAHGVGEPNRLGPDATARRNGEGLQPGVSRGHRSRPRCSAARASAIHRGIPKLARFAHGAVDGSDRGIATRRGVMASHLEKTYTSRYGKVSLPVTEEATRTTMLIPLFATMTDEEQSWVIDSLREELGTK